MTKLYYKQDKVTIFQGDCKEVVTNIAPIDAVVTDPPYGLSFMGKCWDHGVPGIEFWNKIIDVMKPGGHLLAFGGTRTHHRLTCAIEDAGFEIRDCVMWVFGSGFPKSLNVAKALDKVVGVEFKAVPASSVGLKGKGGYNNTNNKLTRVGDSAKAAKQWDGWGTALKPAYEIIIVARKPLSEKTVAKNVLKHGTGGINIDGCRIGTTKDVPASPSKTKGTVLSGSVDGSLRKETGKEAGHNPNLGRWPANLIHDGSAEVVELFPNTKSGTLTPDMNVKPSTGWSGGSQADRVKNTFTANEGSAARFFYCAKVSKKERGEGNDHPTLKPIALMQYLCRLVTPPGGTILDPFMGSGSTLLAAREEGFNSIGIDLDEHYCAIAKTRLTNKLID